MNYRPNPLLYGAHKAFFGTFKLVVTMCDTVDHPLLLDAVHAAVKRYPYFCVTPQKDGNRIQLQHNEAPVPVSLVSEERYTLCDTAFPWEC